MVLSFQFGRQAMCPGVRALLCPEMGPCEKHSVCVGGGVGGVGRGESFCLQCVVSPKMWMG